MMDELAVLGYQDSPTQQKLRRRIFAAAFDLFVEQGLAATTAQQIADRLEVSRRTLYNYYPSKDELAIDLQILILERIQWFQRLTAINSLPSLKELEQFCLTLLTDFLPEWQFIGQFDHYFYESYPNDKYVTYMRSRIGTDTAMLTDKSLQSLMVDGQMLLGYTQRIAMRLAPGETCPPSFIRELSQVCARLVA